jgi:hypothetical protein
VDAPDPLAHWHAFVATGDVGLLDDLLADDVVFRAPTYWTPRHGKLEVALVLGTVATVFEGFRYEREWTDGPDWALEFVARVGNLEIKGVDLIRLDADGHSAEFEVVARPANAVAALGEAMNERLARLLSSQ